MSCIHHLQREHVFQLRHDRDWESYIADDLIAYVDGHYRTLAQRESPGLSGHSMSGYGTVRIGMRCADVFGARFASKVLTFFSQQLDASRR